MNLSPQKGKEMADTVKISGLPALTTGQLTDIFPVVQTGVTYKAAISKYLQGGLNVSFGTINGTSITSTFITNNGQSIFNQNSVATTTGISAKFTGTIPNRNGGGTPFSVVDGIVINHIFSVLDNTTYIAEIDLSPGITVASGKTVSDLYAVNLQGGSVDPGSLGTITRGTTLRVEEPTYGVTVLAAKFLGAVNIGTTGQMAISRLGVISGSATWNATAIGVLYGGTGQTSYTDGQLLIGNTSGNTLTKATLTAGTGISITNGNGSITVSASTTGVTWSVIGANQTLAVENGYICTTGGALSLALPTMSSIGQTIEVVLDGSTSWTITQPNAATQIRLGNKQTTLGVGGTLSSSAVGDAVKLVCETANARWIVTSSIGNLGGLS